MKALRKKEYDAVLTMLSDIIDAEVMEKASTVKVYSNCSIGFNNFDVETAKARGVVMSNAPCGGVERVSEHTWAFILALTCRIVEGDNFMRKGKYNGWDPMLLWGEGVEGKTLGIIGSGHIGASVARKGKNGFGMKIAYYDIKRNEQIENELGAVFYPSIEELLKISDIVSLHVPLLDSTYHLLNADRLKIMKPTAYLINTSRGPVVDENALVNALKNRIIKGAGLDVFEFEPKLAKGLTKLPNVILTPHIASATKEARVELATVSAQNIVSFLENGIIENSVILPF